MSKRGFREKGRIQKLKHGGTLKGREPDAMERTMGKGFWQTKDRNGEPQRQGGHSEKTLLNRNAKT